MDGRIRCLQLPGCVSTPQTQPMGLDIHGARLLIAAKKRGVCFDRTLTFGRIELAVLPHRLVELFQSAGLSDAALAPLLTQESRPLYAEPVFQALGAKEILSLDASSYQDASIVHDMNQPLPDAMKQGFDVVFDGGSIEHVFNFPVAIRNCMELLKVGGSLFIHTAANNCMGHGFYQFSPELFYRVFSKPNGFEVARLILHGSGPYGAWYDVADPAVIHSRVELISFMPTQMLLHARRNAACPIFAQAPQQSDYVEEWQRPASTPTSSPNTSPISASPAPWTRFQKEFEVSFPRAAGAIKALRTAFRFYRTQSLWNRTFYQKAKD